MSLIRKIIPSELIFIAEIGINHNGDPETALRLVEAAGAAGAHAVKFQTMEPAEMYSVYTSALMEKGREEYADRRQIDFFSGFTLAENDYAAIQQKAGSLGMVFFSAPFDGKSVELLERLGAPLYKLASSEVTNRGLLERVASTGRPVLMSTGICTEEEILMALETLDDGGCPEVLLLHCVSLYPMPPERANLARIASLRERYGREVGFSDHSAGTKAAEYAALLGARVFEKHFTLGGEFECPDRNVSLDPEQFGRMVSAVKEAAAMRGDGHISFDFWEKEVAKSARRSLFSRELIPKGKVLGPEDVAAKRPGMGMPPREIDSIIGRKAKVDIPGDYLLRPEHFE